MPDFYFSISRRSCHKQLGHLLQVLHNVAVQFDIHGEASQDVSKDDITQELVAVS